MKFAMFHSGWLGRALAAAFLSTMPCSSGVWAADAGLVITSPASGSLFKAGEQVAIVVHVTSGSYPAGIAVMGQDPLGASKIQIVNGLELRFALQIPERVPPGSYSLTALGPNTAGQLISSVPVTIKVEGAQPAADFTIDPASITFGFVGDSLPITVIAKSGVGITDVTRSSLLVAASENALVATVKDGIVMAAGSGKTKIDIRYGSFTHSIVISVPASIRGDLNGDGQVDESDLHVLQAGFLSGASGPNDARDLNHDGILDEMDVEILKVLCTHPYCATQ